MTDRVFPPGGVERIDYGIHLYEDGYSKRIMCVGHNSWARQNGTYQRQHIVWPEDGKPNDEWARYIGPWTEVVRNERLAPPTEANHDNLHHDEAGLVEEIPD